MNKTKPMNFYKFYIVLLLFIRPVLSLLSIPYCTWLVEYIIFLTIIDIVFGIIVAINLKKMNSIGYWLLSYYLIFRLLEISCVYSCSTGQLFDWIAFLSAVLTYGFVFALPVCIYFKKRKHLFFDQPETESESPSQIRIDFNHPTIQNQIALDQNEAVPAQPEPIIKQPDNDIKFCRHCGKELLENTNFCRNCGQKSK